MRAEYIQHVGDDMTVVNAARVSFDKESAWDDQIVSYNGASVEVIRTLPKSDAKLINYLATHGHWTPFSHCFVTLRETVPIFVARQRFKHMVGFSYNEVSRRYVDSEPEFFVPDIWRGKAENKKQGSTDVPVEGFNDANDVWTTPQDCLDAVHEVCLANYKELLAMGVCPEQARMVLPQSMYTSYYVSGSLAAWARMYKQRIDSHAQKEIQDLAKMVGEVIAPLYPHSWEALTT